MPAEETVVRTDRKSAPARPSPLSLCPHTDHDANGTPATAHWVRMYGAQRSTSPSTRNSGASKSGSGSTPGTEIGGWRRVWSANARAEQTQHDPAAAGAQGSNERIGDNNIHNNPRNKKKYLSSSTTRRKRHKQHKPTKRNEREKTTQITPATTTTTQSTSSATPARPCPWQGCTPAHAPRATERRAHPSRGRYRGTCGLHCALRRRVQWQCLPATCCPQCRGWRPAPAISRAHRRRRRPARRYRGATAPLHGRGWPCQPRGPSALADGDDG